jgi:hypothetical protein
MREPFMPCPCGEERPPKPVNERGRRRLKVVRVRCRGCGLTSKSARLDRVSIAWNLAVEGDLMRRRDEVGIAR